MKKDKELPWVIRLARWLALIYAVGYVTHCFMNWFFLEVQMFLSEKNLPSQGKALAWAIVSVVCAVAFWLVCDAIGRLS